LGKRRGVDQRGALAAVRSAADHSQFVAQRQDGVRSFRYR
jgi:hypothetical protein